MFAQWDTELETRIKSVAIHFANVIIHAARAQHGAGDACVDRQLRRKFADVLCPGDDDLIADNQLLQLIDELWETIDNLPGAGEPGFARIDATPAKPHEIGRASCRERV